MDEGIHAAKLNASIGCRQIVVCIGFILIPCNQCVSRSWEYCKKRKKIGIYAATLNARIGCRKKVSKGVDSGVCVL